MTTLAIGSIADLETAKYASDLSEVVVHTDGFKYRGLLPHALKYGFWALRPGGTLTILDGGPEHSFLATGSVSFHTVRQLTFALLGPGSSIKSIDYEACTIQLERTAPRLGETWGAGVIFSGQASETPELITCLDALSKQSVLAGRKAVYVCMPQEGDKGFLEDFPDTNIVAFEYAGGKPFPIARKKNTLVEEMAGDKIAILHARIKLDPDALTKAPPEFDFAAPNVQLDVEGRRVPYLAYSTIDPIVPYSVPRSMPRNTRNLGSKSYLTALARRRPFIDGGAILASRQAYLDCPQNPYLGWGDAEDIEWCRRAELNGYLVDFHPAVTCLSSTNKVSDTHNLPTPLYDILQSVNVRLKHVRGLARLALRSGGRG